MKVRWFLKLTAILNYSKHVFKEFDENFISTILIKLHLVVLYILKTLPLTTANSYQQKEALFNLFLTEFPLLLKEIAKSQ